jgi:hypothetical protein
MYLYQKMPEFQFIIKSVFIALKNMGDINVMNLLSWSQSVLCVVPGSVTVAGFVTKRHGVNRGRNYLRFQMDYCHWKTYFLPRLGTL